LIEESTVILRKINQTIPSSGVSGGRVYSLFYEIMFYYKIKVGLKETKA